jgi:hypothetical protein
MADLAELAELSRYGRLGRVGWIGGVVRLSLTCLSLSDAEGREDASEHFFGGSFAGDLA